MPEPIHIKFDGIPGSSTISGREDTSEVYELSHLIRSPTDMHNGRVTGTRQHGAFKVTIPVGKQSPDLRKRVCEGETIPMVTLNFYKIDDAGAEVEYATVCLEKVKISSCNMVMKNIKDREQDHTVHCEEIEMRYKVYDVCSHEGGFQYKDDFDLKT